MFAELLQPLGLAEEYGVAFNESGILFEVRRICIVYLSSSLHPEQLSDVQDPCLVGPVRRGNNV